MSKLVVLPYKTESASAKIVSEMLGVKRMLVVGSNLKDSEETTIVNWGNSTTDLSGLPSVKVINKQEGIRKASNKRDFFRAIQDHNEVSESPISIPDWTEDSAVAKEWYESGHDVVCRHTLQGHSGEGIEVVKFREEVEAEHAVPEAPLYTKYVKKRDEYRVHVVAKEAIFVQRKGRERDGDGSEDINYQIRNHANGFIFLTQDLNPHKTVISESIKAVNALGLDFGAVDVIWNERRKAATVIEVNTACGLQSPSNIVRYRQALKALLANEEQLPWDSPCEREELQLDLTDAVTAIEGMRIDSSNNINMPRGTNLGSLGLGVTSNNTQPSLRPLGLGVTSNNTQPTNNRTYSVREGIEAGALTEGNVRLDAEAVTRSHVEMLARVHAEMEAREHAELEERTLSLARPYRGTSAAVTRAHAEMERAYPTNPSYGSASPTVGLMRELRELYPDNGESYNNRLRDDERVWLRPRVLDVLRNFIFNHPNHSVTRTLNDMILGSRSQYGLLASQCNGGQGMALVSGRSGMSWALPQSALTTSSPYMGEDLRA